MWIATNIGAGSGTTAALLTALIHFITSNPETYSKVVSELKNVKVSFPASWTEVQKLPYLNACIKETERLHPGVGLHLERVVPKGGAIICGKHLPAGTVVGANPWVINRDKGVFGQDSEIWRPERWLVDSAKRSKMESTLLTVCFTTSSFRKVVC